MAAGFARAVTPLVAHEGVQCMAEFNLAAVVEAVARTVPEHWAILSRSQRVIYAAFMERSRRLAAFLAARGYGCYAERGGLAGHEVGQHLMAQYLRNGPEYLEGMIGAARARVAPFNVNYRYTAGELAYLLDDAGPGIIQFHAEFAPLLADVLGRRHREILLHRGLFRSKS
jgi:3-oxocholest-4-en-26-oate---CoA ligase